MSVSTPDIFERETEIAALARFVERVPAGRAGMLIEGAPGVGKSTLFWEGTELLKRSGCRVLSSTPAEPETKLSFTGLRDLLEPVLDEGISALPPPQAHALEVALLLKEAEGGEPDWRGVSVATLSMLRALAATSPLVVAVDDLHWLDRSTSRALQFALRRLTGEPVGVLSTVRSAERHGSPIRLERILPPAQLSEITVGPLSRRGISQLLLSRFGPSLPRPVVTKIHRISGGNPFFALELARAWAALAPEWSDEIPVPEDLQDLLRARIANLSPATREALVIVSALADPTPVTVGKVMGDDVAAVAALEDATGASIVHVSERRVAFTHPLLSAAIYSELSPNQKRALHGRIAEVIEDPEERPRHLALAADGPDAGVAAALEAGAASTRARGATDAAAELLATSARLTPESHSEDRLRRTLGLGEYLFEAGDSARARGVFEDVVAQLGPGPARADALRRLAKVRFYGDSLKAAAHLLTEALGEVGDRDPFTRAEIERDLAMASLMCGDTPGGEAHARAALRAANELEDPALIAQALVMLGLMEFVQGRGMPLERLERAFALEEWTEDLPIVFHPSGGLGVVLKWMDQLDAARDRLQGMRLRAIERGYEDHLPFLLFHLAELEVWAGNWRLAERHASEGYEAASETGQEPVRAFALYAKALVEAHLGRMEAARRFAEEGLSVAEHAGGVPGIIMNLAVLGFIELSVSNPSGVHAHLGRLAELALATGVGDPGFVRYLPDEIEALIALGDVDKSQAFVDHLEERARALDRASSLASAARCRALLVSALGDAASAFAHLDEALRQHERVNQPFELARTLLIRGQVERRAKKKGAARLSLEHALQIFDRLPAPLWAERARQELARIGGRAPSPHALTPTEQRVADLVAEGLSNKEVAQALFMSPKTVEWTLSKAFLKLGVGSRRELARTIQPPR